MCICPGRNLTINPLWLLARLASVRFHVWVWCDEPINVDVDNAELLARGVSTCNHSSESLC